jgi:hypothetical protein
VANVADESALPALLERHRLELVAHAGAGLALLRPARR